MYVCLCNPFTDKDVKNALAQPGKKTAGSIYKSCTGGQKPCCGTCVCMLRDMVAAHKEDEALIAAE